MAHALIDADSFCYVAAILAANESEEQARFNLNAMLEDTLIDLNTQDYTLFITDNTNNFRNKVYPEYKANRKDVPKPLHLQMLKDHIRDEWKALVSDGCEADDMVGVHHFQHNAESIIVSIDKDLDQYYGWHWNPKKKERYLISPEQATRFFYYQLLVGDTADNIRGCKGIGKVKAEKLLSQCETEEEMFNMCRDSYGCDEELEMNAKCLYLWKEMDDIWKWPEWASPKEALDV